MKKIVVAVVTTFLLVLAGLNLTVSYFASKYIKNNIIDKLPSVNGIKAEVGSVWVNLLFFKVDLGNFVLSAPSGFVSTNVLEAKNVSIDVEILPLFFRKVIVEQVVIKDPLVNIEFKSNDKALPIPLPLLNSGAAGSLVDKIALYGRNYSGGKKYPPVTLENIAVDNGTVRFINLSQDSDNLLIWENVNVFMPKFWRSLDYAVTEARYSMTANVTGNGGFMKMSGDLRSDLGVVDNTGSLEIIDLDLSLIHKFNKKLLPLKSVAGRLSIKGDLSVEANTLAVPLEFTFSEIKFEYVPEQKKVYGLSKSMLEELLKTTKGEFNFKLDVSGDVGRPRVNYETIPNQLLKQYLMKSAEEDITKKADRYGRYLTDKILKK